MKCIIFVMAEENYIISVQKPENRQVIHKHLRCMDVQTAVVVGTKRNVFINIMLKKMLRKIKS